MSYHFSIPALGPEGQLNYCQLGDFLDAATVAGETYFKTWSESKERAASERAATAAVHAASLLAQTGIVGDNIRVIISGHANPVPASPPEGWSNDHCQISLYAETK